MDKVSRGKYVLPSHLSSDARDLITRLLQREPERRLAIQQVLTHPFFGKHSHHVGFTTPIPSVAPTQRAAPRKELDSTDPTFSSFSLEFSSEAPFPQNSTDFSPAPYQSTPASRLPPRPATHVDRPSLPKMTPPVLQPPTQTHPQPQAHHQWRSLPYDHQDRHRAEPPVFSHQGLRPPTSITQDPQTSRPSFPPLAPLQTNGLLPLHRPASLLTAPPSEKDFASQHETQEKLVPFSTKNLAPVRQRTSRGFLEILSNGSVTLSLDDEKHCMNCESDGGLVCFRLSILHFGFPYLFIYFYPYFRTFIGSLHEKVL